MPPPWLPRRLLLLTPERPPCRPRWPLVPPTPRGQRCSELLFSARVPWCTNSSNESSEDESIELYDVIRGDNETGYHTAMKEMFASEKSGNETSLLHVRTSFSHSPTPAPAPNTLIFPARVYIRIVCGIYNKTVLKGGKRPSRTTV